MDSSLTFKRYCSFDNHYDSKLIHKIREFLTTFKEKEGIWEATEKVHGSHFAVSVTRNELSDVYTLRGAKRSGFIDSNEKFYNFQEIIERYREKIEIALLLVQGKYPEVTQITIHGEIFGGLYPGKAVRDAIKVQNDVFYSPNNDWYVFDIHDGKRYLDSDFTERIFKKCGFFYAQPLCIGTFEEVLQYNNTFNSTLPKLLKSPDWENLEDNLAEGLVLKPRKVLYFSSGSRVMLKSKTEKFSEKITKQSKERKKIKAETKNPEADAIWDAISLYITENRLNNVKSKDPSITGKKLIGPLAKDVMDEFIRCHEDEELVKTFEEMDKKKKGLVTRRLSNACSKLVEGF
jgi:Rnl2 family RNA ligase